MKTKSRLLLTNICLVCLSALAILFAALLIKQERALNRKDALITDYKAQIYRLEHPEVVTNYMAYRVAKPARKFVWIDVEDHRVAAKSFQPETNYPVLHRIRTVPERDGFMYPPRWLQE